MKPDLVCSPWSVHRSGSSAAPQSAAYPTARARGGTRDLPSTVITLVKLDQNSVTSSKGCLGTYQGEQEVGQFLIRVGKLDIDELFGN